jgi:hypothetical protein
MSGSPERFTSSGVPTVDDAAFVDDGDAVGHAEREVAVVRNDDGRDVDALFEFQDFLADDDGGERIQFAGRLVVKINCGSMTSARAMAARFFMPPESSFGILSAASSGRRLQVFPRRCVLISSGDLSRCSVEIKPDVFTDRERIEQRAGLEHQRHVVFAPISGDWMDSPLIKNFSGVRRIKSDDVLEQNAFAAAAWPHDDKNFAGLDFEINALEHFLTVKTFAQPAHLDADAGIVVVELFIFQQDTRQYVIKNHDENDGIDDRLRDGAADAARPADGHQALMARNNADDERETKAFENAVGHVLRVNKLSQVCEKRLKRNGHVIVRFRDHRAAEPADEHREKITSIGSATAIATTAATRDNGWD